MERVALRWRRLVLMLDPATGERLGPHGAEVMSVAPLGQRVGDRAR